MTRVNKTLIVLSGCPASGKSVLLSRIVQVLSASYIKIDDLLNTYHEFSPENYHNSRKILLEETEKWINLSPGEVLVVEDTNHLKSLVKPFKLMCKVYSVKFLHLILKIPLLVAVERNESRHEKVIISTLEKIFYQIDEEKFFKESILLEYDNIYDNIILNYAVLAQVPIRVEENGTFIEPSYKHILDCKLRKKIKEIIESSEGSKQETAKKLVSIKTCILKKIKKLDYSEYQEALDRAIKLLSE